MACEKVVYRDRDKLTGEPKGWVTTILWNVRVVDSRHPAGRVLLGEVGPGASRTTKCIDMERIRSRKRI